MAWHQFGDNLEKALQIAGITHGLVEKFAGPNCGCADRRERLNQLGIWIRRTIRGKSSNPSAELDSIISSNFE
jgi:hypothetical protein